MKICTSQVVRNLSELRNKSRMCRSIVKRERAWVYIFSFASNIFSGLLQVQKHCSAEVISCVSNFFHFRGVLQVQKHCSARVNSSLHFFFFCVRVSKYLMYTTLTLRRKGAIFLFFVSHPIPRYFRSPEKTRLFFAYGGMSFSRSQKTCYVRAGATKTSKKVALCVEWAVLRV